LAKKNGTPFIVSGSGHPLRQFIYSEDLARLIIWTLESYDSIEPIILSVDPADEISIKDVANYIAEAMEYTDEIIFDCSRAD
jgi:GDP-L-fucose synthase